MANDGYFGAPSHLRGAQAQIAAGCEPSNPPQVNEAQARCDAIQAEFRAGGQQQRRSIRRDPPPKPRALVPTDDALQLRLAEELEYARRMVEQMGDTLSADPIVIGRHMIALQAVDIVGQMLGHLASVVRSSDPGGAVECIGMSDLKARLQRKSGL